MCGIVLQFYNDTKKQASIEVTAQMLSSITHRGSDQNLIHNYKNFHIGFVRLALTDINIPQPGESKNWSVFLNGEIYNYNKLGYSGSECEVIAKGLEEEGVSFISKLNGMFFIVAVHNKKDVYCFRDRYGIKPAYIYRDNEVTLISSEIKPILKHPNYKFMLDELALKQWFTLNNNISNTTLFKNIRVIHRGSMTHVNTTWTTYWNFWRFIEDEKITFDFAVNKTRELVENAFKLQEPEQKYGICLSSGIDSNIINCLARKDSYSFTAGFVGDNLDVPNEAIIAGKYGINNHQIIYDDVCFLKEAIYHTEDLRVGASWSHFGLYKFASKFVKILFDGAGADELFGGYTWRYNAKDYYSVVNRTGKKCEEVKQLFELTFLSDNIRERFCFDAEYFLESILLVGDKLSMAHTIEMRFPFLDNDLVDFAQKIPFKYKTNKQVLKEAFKDLLPEEILSGTKKGFSSPDWFTGEGNKAMKWSNIAYETWKELYYKQ